MTKRGAVYYEEKAKAIRLAVAENIVDDLYVVTVRAYDKARNLDADHSAVELLEDVLETLHQYRR